MEKHPDRDLLAPEKEESVRVQEGSFMPPQTILPVPSDPMEPVDPATAVALEKMVRQVIFPTLPMALIGAWIAQNGGEK